MLGTGLFLSRVYMLITERSECDTDVCDQLNVLFKIAGDRDMILVKLENCLSPIPGVSCGRFQVMSLTNARGAESTLTAVALCKPLLDCMQASTRSSYTLVMTVVTVR